GAGACGGDGCGWFGGRMDSGADAGDGSCGDEVLPTVGGEAGDEGCCVYGLRRGEPGADAGGDSGFAQGCAGAWAGHDSGSVAWREAGVYGCGCGDERQSRVYRRAAGGGVELPDWAVQ